MKGTKLRESSRSVYGCEMERTTHNCVEGSAMQSSETYSTTLSCIIFFNSSMAILISISWELYKRALQHCWNINFVPRTFLSLTILLNLFHDGVIFVQRGTYEEVEAKVCMVPVLAAHYSIMGQEKSSL